MRKLRMWTMIAGATLAAGPWTSAQTPRFERVELDSSRFPEIEARFELLDAGNDIVLGLDSSTFQVLEENRQVIPTVTVSEPTEGVAFVILIDASRSMQAALPTVRNFVATALAGFGESDRGALVVFSDSPLVARPAGSTTSPFTRDKAALVDLVGQVRPSGESSRPYFAIHESLQLLRQSDLPKKKVLIVISDGETVNDRFTLEDCVGEAGAVGAKIIAIGIPDAGQAGLLDLRRLSERSRGIYWEGETSGVSLAEVKRLLSHIRIEQRANWISTLPRDGHSHGVTLEARVSGDVIRASASITSPAAQPSEAGTEEWPPAARIGLVIGGVLALTGVIYLVMMAMGPTRRNRGADTKDQSPGRRQTVPVTQVQGPEHDKARVGPGALPPVSLGPFGGPDAGSPGAEGGPRPRRVTVFMPSGGGRSEPVKGWVEIADGPQKGTRFPLAEEIASVGRETDNSIVLADERVSSRHARIAFREGGYWLEDLDSLNGTYLENGERLKRPHRLRNGELVRLGGVVVQFRFPDGP